jgi:surface protein
LEQSCKFGKSTIVFFCACTIYLQIMLSCSQHFNQDISSWDVSRVTNFQNTFAGATAFNQNMCPWNVHMSVSAAVTTMFSGASSCASTATPGMTPFTPLCQFCYFACFPDKPTLTTVIGQNYADPNAYPYATYGAIEDWCFDAALTDFSSLFQGKTGFNSDLSQWVSIICIFGY